MANFRQPAGITLATLAAVTIDREPVLRALGQARDGWRDEPLRMAARIGVSFVLGQGIFWVYGMDQIGFSMEPKWSTGLGFRRAERLLKHLPGNTRTAWTLKAIEVVADYAKCYTEGATYRRHGLAPDAVAVLFTQPLWSRFEAAEKLAGALLFPARVVTPEGMRLSLACIDGSLFRLVQAGALHLVAPVINDSINRLPSGRR